MRPRKRDEASEIIRKACDFTGRWLRRHGLSEKDVSVFELLDNNQPVDAICLDSRQLSMIPKKDIPKVVHDLEKARHLVFLPIPKDG